MSRVPREIVDARRLRAAELFDQGYRVREIAAALEAWPSTISNDLNKMRPGRRRMSGGRPRGSGRPPVPPPPPAEVAVTVNGRVPGLIEVFLRELREENYRNALAHDAEEAASRGAAGAGRLRELHDLSARLTEAAEAVARLLSDPWARASARGTGGRDDLRPSPRARPAAPAAPPVMGEPADAGRGAIWATPALLAEARRALETGESSQSLGARLGVSATTVRRALIYARGYVNGLAAATAAATPPAATWRRGTTSRDGGEVRWQDPGLLAAAAEAIRTGTGEKTVMRQTGVPRSTVRRALDFSMGFAAGQVVVNGAHRRRDEEGERKA